MTGYYVKQLSLLCFLLIVISQSLEAQVITQRFYGGKANKINLTDTIPTLTLPPIDLTRYLNEDVQRTKDGHPFRFGINIDVNIDLLAVAGRFDTQTDRIYRYELYSPGAYSLNLILDKIQLVTGAQLYLYDPAMTMQIGPITALQNTQTGEFWSDLIQGERLVLELREPVNLSTTSQVHLRYVVHGYKNVFISSEKINESGDCEVNVACFPEHLFEGDGVVVILTQNGTSYCSGSILNDSRQSFRSFLLSANHCGVTDNSLIRFKYQSPTCTPTTAPAQVITMNGSDFRAAYAGSDFSLRELKSQIPSDANVTYLGWNRADSNFSNTFGIHHPKGDVKKLSFTNADTQISGYVTSVGNTHLHAYWNNQGVTEAGSSGSPLFDESGQVIGQLHGGPSSCSATGEDRSDYYGRFFSSWAGGGTIATRLSSWLDPTTLGYVTMAGAKPVLSGPAIVTNSGSFSINTGTASVTSWSIAGATGVVSTTSGVGNVANLVVLSSANSLTITFSIDAGQSYPIQFSKEFNALAVPDLTPILYAQPSVLYGTSVINVVVDVVELNSKATSGLITAKVSKDAKVDLSFDANLSTLAGHNVQNASWSFSSEPGYYVLTTSQSIPGGSKLSFGLSGTITPGGTKGIVTSSATLLGGSGSESKFTNNTDADKVEYFVK